MRRLFPGQNVTMGTAISRAYRSLDFYYPKPASWIANSIWPGHDMTPQGAGGSASRILKIMRERDLAKWVYYNESSHGWVKMWYAG